jgi:alkylation response protein AidB-like acyl-CoA dehydrogenase
MDLSLSEEQEAFRALARDFLEKEAVPHRTEWDRAESVDLAIVPKMAEIGFFGLTIPEEYGGLGGDYVTYVLGMEELGRADSALRGIVSVSNGLVGKSILGFGSEEQKHAWLPGIATAETLGCFGLTEPGTGSDAGNLTTRATRDGDGYVLNGQKLFITNGTWADVALVFARTSDDGPRGVTAFLVPTDTDGFEAREIKGKLGLRGQATAELFLEDVRVPAEARLGEEGQGFKIAMSSLDKGRVSVAAGCVGLVQACLESSVEYATSRTQFGRPIAGFQLVQSKLANMLADTTAMQLMCFRLAQLQEAGTMTPPMASLAKLHNVQRAKSVCATARDILGGNGLLLDFHVARHVTDMEIVDTYEGTDSIQSLIVGRDVTGLSAFS